MREGKFIENNDGKKSNLYFEKSIHYNKDYFEADVDTLKDIANKKEGPIFDFLEKYGTEDLDAEKKQIMDAVIDSANKIIKKYGRQISADDIHTYLLPPVLLQKLSNIVSNTEIDANVMGQSFAQMRTIVIADDIVTRSNFACVAFHELMHILSFQRLRVAEDYVSEERNGLIVINKENPQNNKLQKINEAVTQKLTSNFLKSIFSNSFFEEDFNAISDWHGERRDNTYMVARRDLKGNVEVLPESLYSEEVNKLEILLKDIYVASKDEYSSVEEVFDVFANAYFSGNMIGLAKLIEKAKEKGSFREIVEKF